MMTPDRGEVPRELAILLDGTPAATLHPTVPGAAYTLRYAEPWRGSSDAYRVRQLRAVRMRGARILPMLIDLAERVPEAARTVAGRAASAGMDEEFLAKTQAALAHRAAACAGELGRALRA